MKLDIICSSDSPFIALETYARVCTAKLDAHLINMSYNSRYFAQTQYANSMSFVVDLVNRGHTSILEHIGYEIRVTEECSNIRTLLNSVTAWSLFNNEYNLEAGFRLYPGADEYCFTIGTDLRTLTAIFFKLDICKFIFENLSHNSFKNPSDSFSSALHSLFYKILNTDLELGLYLYKLREKDICEVMAKVTPDIRLLETFDRYRHLVDMNLVDNRFGSKITELYKTKLTSEMVRVSNIQEIYMNTQSKTDQVLIDQVSNFTATLIDNRDIKSTGMAEKLFTFILVAPMPILEHFMRYKTRLGLTKLSGRYTSFSRNKVYTRQAHRLKLATEVNAAIATLGNCTSSESEAKRFLQPMGSLSMMVFTKPLRLLLPLFKDRLASATQIETQLLAKQMFDSVVITVGKETMESMWQTYYGEAIPEKYLSGL